MTDLGDKARAATMTIDLGPVEPLSERELLTGGEFVPDPLAELSSGWVRVLKRVEAWCASMRGGQNGRPAALSSPPAPDAAHAFTSQPFGGEFCTICGRSCIGHE